MANVRRQVSTTGKIFYNATWSLYDKDGTRRRQTKAFEKLSAARAHAAKMEAECEKRGVGDVDRQTRGAPQQRLGRFRGQVHQAKTGHVAVPTRFCRQIQECLKVWSSASRQSFS